MAKLPYMKFFVDDWLCDEKLRACSSAARGLWIDVLCLMFKNDRRGYLQLDGKPVSPLQLARMTGRTEEEVSQQLAELIDAGVPSVSATGDLFSRRIIRDEHISEVRAKAGVQGSNVTNGVCRGKTIGKSSATESANSQQKCGSEYDSESGSKNLEKEKGGPGERENQNGFTEFWSAYPRKQGKDAARRAWLKLRPDEELRGKLLEALAGQKKSAPWSDPQFIPHPASWLNGRRWEDEPLPPANHSAKPPVPRRETRSEAFARLAREHEEKKKNEQVQ